MRRAVSLGLSVVLGACVYLGVMNGEVQAQMAQVAPEQTISTTGHGEVQVKPDSLSLTVAVESQAPTVNQVRTDINNKMQQVVSSIKALSIPNLELQTQSINLYPVYSREEKDRLPRIIGYRGSNRVQVTVTQASPDNLGLYAARVFDTVLSQGIQNLTGPNFFVKDLSGPRAQALAKAVQDAKASAQVMAEAAGVALTGLYSLEGTPQYGGGAPPRMMAMRAEAADAMPTPVEIGEISVTSDVVARFRF